MSQGGWNFFSSLFRNLDFMLEVLNLLRNLFGYTNFFVETPLGGKPGRWGRVLGLFKDTHSIPRQKSVGFLLL